MKHAPRRSALEAVEVAAADAIAATVADAAAVVAGDAIAGRNAAPFGQSRSVRATKCQRAVRSLTTTR